MDLVSFQGWVGAFRAFRLLVNQLSFVTNYAVSALHTFGFYVCMCTAEDIYASNEFHFSRIILVSRLLKSHNKIIHNTEVLIVIFQKFQAFFDIYLQISFPCLSFRFARPCTLEQ